MKVYVGMSGGVDSSLSAALLVEKGYDVVGVYMKNWTEDLPGMQCPWANDLADAKRVAVKLNIPFKVFDFQTEYKRLVVDYMIQEYSLGRTPNPDIMCNQEIKFGMFLKAALADGADMIATGHYARTDNKNLLRAVNEAKDQTYFLYRVTGEAIEKTMFPIGDFSNKDEVRAEAAKRNLSTATKRDSQGICFVGSVGIREFLSQYVKTKPGDIIDNESGKVLGHHDGAIFYTFGQRHGLNIGGGLPYYVVGKDMAKNQVYVSQNIRDEAMWRTRLELINLHWINSQPPTGDETLYARLRHRGELRLCSLHGSQLMLMQPERAVAAGQSAVLYRGQECIGGGIIAMT